jgi:hypothetical protein
MSYKLEFDPRAERQFYALPDSLQAFLGFQLTRLAESPTTISRPMIRHGLGQIAEFFYDRGGVTLAITVTFFYGQDEQTLHVSSIAVEFAG